MVQLDCSVGRIIRAIDNAGFTADTLVIFSSDNGPVYDDGYNDGSSDDAGQGHNASGPPS